MSQPYATRPPRPPRLNLFKVLAMRILRKEFKKLSDDCERFKKESVEIDHNLINALLVQRSLEKEFRKLIAENRELSKANIWYRETTTQYQTIMKTAMNELHRVINGENHGV